MSARASASTGTAVIRLPGHGATGSDNVVVEEPLEVRLRFDRGDGGQPLAVVMRTPGDDFDLAWGLAITEGVVDAPGAIVSTHWGMPADFNAVELVLAEGAVDAGALANRRPWLSTPSCGLCGKDSVDAIARFSGSLMDAKCRLPLDTLLSLPEALRASQTVFNVTGGLHAAGAFDAGGTPVCVREDIGRHNAVDKVVGYLARQELLPAHHLIMVVSGRAGFEIVQKAAAAGIPVLVSVSAPSSLAVDAALAVGMTLACFVRDGHANIYSWHDRIVR